MNFATIAENPAMNAYVGERKNKLLILIKTIKYDPSETKNTH